MRGGERKHESMESVATPILVGEWHELWVYEEVPDDVGGVFRCNRDLGFGIEIFQTIKLSGIGWHYDHGEVRGKLRRYRYFSFRRT